MTEVLERLDARFVRIYEAARAERLARERHKGLIVIHEDVLLLYRGEEPVRQFTGLEPTAGRPFGLYIHVPFCATRCGYCDFNTYTPAELGGANPDYWLVALRSELAAGGVA